MAVSKEKIIIIIGRVKPETSQRKREGE